MTLYCIFGALKFEEFVAQLSLRDPDNEKKYIGSVENWDKAEQAIINAAKYKGLKTVIEYGDCILWT